MIAVWRLDRYQRPSYTLNILKTHRAWRRLTCMRKMHRCSVWITVVFLLSACAASQRGEKKSEIIVSSKELPRTVAVLPFGNDTDEVGISGQVRKSFSNHFSSKPYQKIEPYIVDEKIAQMEKSAGATIFDIPPKEVAKAIDADGLIYGKVTGFSKVYALAYSQMGAEAEEIGRASC